MLERFFSKPADSQPDPIGLIELVARVRVLEREIEDLHASYRRIRASQAQSARDAPAMRSADKLQDETLQEKKRRVRMQLANRGFSPGVVPRGEEEV